MKIAHVLPALTKGGGERVMADLATQAAEAGHEVTIIAARAVDAELLLNSLHPDIQVLYVSDTAASKGGKYLRLLPWLWRHREWLRQQDVVHCHLTYGEVFGCAVRFLFPAWGLSRPVIVGTCHSVGMAMPTMNRWVHARMASQFDAFALMAEDDYWRAFIDRRPTLLSAVIPNGISFRTLTDVDQATRQAYRHQIGIPGSCRHLIGMVGRLHPDRKPWLYIPIFAAIAAEFGPDVHFVLAGAGPELDRIRSLIAEHGLQDQVHLPGLILEPRLPLSLMDLYITLNVGERTGIAGLEAAYMKVPVVAIQLLASYKTKPEDWIWSDANLSMVAVKAIELLRRREDLLALAVLQAAHVRSHYTVDTMARSYDALYSKARDRHLVR